MNNNHLRWIGLVLFMCVCISSCSEVSMGTISLDAPTVDASESNVTQKLEIEITVPANIISVEHEREETALTSDVTPEQPEECVNPVTPNIDFWGTWEVIEEIPEILVTLGIPPKYGFTFRPLDAIGKEIEYNQEFYRFDGKIFVDITYTVENVSPLESLYSHLSFVRERVMTLDVSDKTRAVWSEGSAVYEKSLYEVYVEGIEFKSGKEVGEEEREEERLVITGMSFIIIDDNYILLYPSGLLCRRIL